MGTKARLIIPPVMAYGKRGSGRKIPPDATLCFEVELVEIAGKVSRALPGRNLRRSTRSC